MKKTSAKINFLYSMVYQLLIMILPLVTAPYLARVIGAEGAGVYSYTSSIAMYFLYFAMLGVNNYGNRYISQVRDKGQKEINQTFSSIFTFQLITSIIAILAYTIYLIIGVKDHFNIAAFQLIFICSAILDINWLFFGLEEFKKTVTRKIFIKLATVICVFIFVKSVDDLWKYTLIMCLGTLIGQAYLWLFVRKYAAFVKFDYTTLLKHIKPNILLFIPLIAVSIYRIMDKVMLGNFSSMEQVGYYEYSEKLINISLAAIAALGTVMLPKMSNLAANKKEKESKEYLGKSMQVAIFMGCAIAFGLASISTDFIPVFYGNGFENSIGITKILTITVIFISWANVIRMQYLLPNNLERIFVRAVCIGAILNILFNFIMIPKYGAVGAALGTVVAEIFVSVYQTICVHKKLDIKKYIMQSRIYLFSGIVMYCVVTFVASIGKPSVILLIFEVFIGALVYVTLCVIYYIKTKNTLFFSLIKFIDKRNILKTNNYSQ